MVAKEGTMETNLPPEVEAAFNQANQVQGNSVKVSSSFTKLPSLQGKFLNLYSMNDSSSNSFRRDHPRR